MNIDALAQKIINIDSSSPEAISADELLKNVISDLNNGNTKTYIDGMETIAEISPNRKKEIKEIVEQLNQIPSKKEGIPKTKEDFKKLTSIDVENLLINQLDSIDFNNMEQTKNFYKYLSGFRNINNYSINNQLLLLLQDYDRIGNAVFDEPLIYGTFNNWKSKKVGIKKGEKAEIICTPSTTTVYFSANEKGDFVVREAPTISEEEKELREKLVKQGKMKKETFISGFNYQQIIFRIDQTSMPEEEKKKYTYNYYHHNSSEENAELLPKIESLCKELGINYKDKEQGLSLGQANGSMTYTSATLKIKDELSSYTDFKIGVAIHEIGHYVLHRHLQNIKAEDNLSRGDREVQAELFSCLAMESLGVDSEVMNSLKYIKGWATLNGNCTVNLSEENKAKILCHLSIVKPAQKLFTEAINNKENALEELKSFIPGKMNKDINSNRYFVANDGYKKLLKLGEKTSNAIKQFN